MVASSLRKLTRVLDTRPGAAQGSKQRKDGFLTFSEQTFEHCGKISLLMLLFSRTSPSFWMNETDEVIVRTWLYKALSNSNYAFGLLHRKKIIDSIFCLVVSSVLLRTARPVFFTGRIVSTQYFALLFPLSYSCIRILARTLVDKMIDSCCGMHSWPRRPVGNCWPFQNFKIWFLRRSCLTFPLSFNYRLVVAVQGENDQTAETDGSLWIRQRRCYSCAFEFFSTVVQPYFYFLLFQILRRRSSSFASPSFITINSACLQPWLFGLRSYPVQEKVKIQEAFVIPFILKQEYFYGYFKSRSLSDIPKSRASVRHSSFHGF